MDRHLDWERPRPSLRQQIEETLRRAATSGYADCVALLTRASGDLFPALRVETNPIIAELHELSADDLGFLIQEYSGFSNAALHMFLEARVRNRWPALSVEILRNMDEEFGALTRGVPHLELMRYGYRDELDLETDGLGYGEATTGLIRRLSALFCTQNNVFLAGALLAFEATAVHEFRCVDLILRQRAARIGRVLEAGSVTAEYIAGHVSPEAGDDDPEVGHFNGMIQAIGADAPADRTEVLARSFLAVCLELSQWWDQISVEVRLRPLRHALSAGREHPDPFEFPAAPPLAAVGAPHYAPVA